ncbi:nuclease-related domain-containing protein [Nocardia australiensis]|uniref:nuclease-related domain-containing protein n=1 Tax=Nocardia australiensis TaxID=2887191 RepID=UPI001D1581F4|nr:nuclease-related domain-containing protein [Nocardia australiensis]
MLVKIEAGASLSGAEHEFVECLRLFPTTCLALVDLAVSDNGSRQVDAVLITPRGITVIEVKGFRRRQSGILDVPADGPWTISDAAVDFDDEGSVGPVDQLEHAVYAVKSRLERGLLDPGHVCGAVALLPFRGAVVRPARTNLRPGIDVVVANTRDATELRIYLESFSAGPRSWTADRVFGACEALGVTSGPSRAELIADGFDAVRPEPHMPQPPEPKPQVAPMPGAPSSRQNIASWTVLAIAIIGLLLILGVIVDAVVHDVRHPDPGSNGTQTTSVDPSPKSYRPVECWPFQPNC